MEDFSKMSDEEFFAIYDGGPEHSTEIKRRMHLRAVRMLVPKAFRGGFASMDEIDCPTWKAHRDRAKQWAEEFSHDTEKGLYFSGPSGCGKSHMAWAVVEALIIKGFWVEGWNIPQMFDEMINSFHDRYYEPSANTITGNAQKADLLMLDDLGAEPTDVDNKTKNWVLQKLYAILNSRCESCLPVLVTGNLSGTDLQGQMPHADGKRVIDRLCGMIETPGLAFTPVPDLCKGCEFLELNDKDNLKCKMKSLRRGR